MFYYPEVLQRHTGCFGTIWLQLVPDARALMAALELAPDPFFGVMGPGLPSPTELPELRLEELPPAEVPAPPARAPRPAGPRAPRVPEEPTLPPPPPEAPPRRRRRPPLTDPQPQIPQAEFQAQLLRPHGHCRELVLLEPPPKRRRTPSELLRNPTCAWLPPELWGLWDRCARRPPPAPPAPPELPSEVEVPREALEPSLPALPPSEVSLEVIEEEARPPLLPPEERRPPPPPAPPVLPELPEVPEPELPPSAVPDVAALRRLVAAAARRPGGTELGVLLPPGTPRSLAGRLFYLCLELCGAGWLRLEQARPYGPITLGPGPRGPPPASPAVGQEGASPSPRH
ncbi:meiotic recombination protein REC8 [Grus japonensis]|uniref:Meiotic recombination protein REC8 n=1 Tax=Grus japonensis TaxID=30415 RepID=A0ABC9Y0D8_GRUJA